MVTVRSSKNKGAQMEYSVHDSLNGIYKDLFLTKQLGFVQQYDLVSDTCQIAIECKFHKSITWNQAKKWFEKLESKAPKDYVKYLIFKSNQQPVLVMFRTFGLGKTKEWLGVCEFEQFFETSFIIHNKKK